MAGKHLAVFITLIAVNCFGAAKSCDGVEIVKRSAWEARSPQDWQERFSFRVPRVIIAHTVTPQCDDKNSCSRIMRSMQNYHMDKNKWPDIGYNFVVGGDGRVYEGVGWKFQGIHTRGFNDKSYAIAFIGNFMNVQPSNLMLNAAKKLIICGIKEGYISRDREIHGHRDATCTDSPGDKLYEIIRHWPRFRRGPLPGYIC